MKSLVKRFVSPRQRAELRMLGRRARCLGWQRYCPVCEAHLRAFVPDPRSHRPGALCPVCHSMERHRAIWPFLLRATLLGRVEARVLHVAPGEGHLARREARIMERVAQVLGLEP